MKLFRLLPFMVLFSIATQFLAVADASSTEISSLRVDITTGGDDLRGGSVAYGVIRLRDGRTLPRVNLNEGRAWGNGSRNTITMPLSGVRLSDLASFTIEHDGAPRNVLDSYDNWNIDAVRVAVPGVCHPGMTILNQSGRPLVRFTGAKTFLESRFSIPASAHGISPTSVQVMITTGGDDLRGGSVAYGVIRLRDGRTLPKVSLNGGRAWGNGSTNTIAMPLSGVRLGDLASFTIEHDGAPRNVLDSYDNWNVDVLKIDTSKTCSGEVVLASQAGRPLVRLTGARTFWTTPLRSP